MHMRIGGIVLFVASLLFGLGAEHYMGANWITEHAFALMLAGCALGLAWALFDFWPRLISKWNNLTWVDLDAAGRYFRDHLETPPLDQAAVMFDQIAIPSGRPGYWNRRSVGQAFLPWLIDGMNEGVLEVWGRPINGSKRIKLSPGMKEFNYQIDTGTRPELSNIPHDSIFASPNEIYCDLEIRRSSIRSLIRGYENDHAQRRAKECRSGEVHQGTREG